MKDILSSDFDVSPYFYVPDEPEFMCVYPLKMEQHIIMVPEALPYSDFTDYLKAVASNDFLGYSSFGPTKMFRIAKVTLFQTEK